MKNKLGMISGLILSLFIAGSAFAYAGSSAVLITKDSKTTATKTGKPKKHKKHAKSAKKKVAKKAKKAVKK